MKRIVTLFILLLLYVYNVNATSDKTVDDYIKLSNDKTLQKDVRLESAKKALNLAVLEHSDSLCKKTIKNYALLNINFSLFLETIKFLQTAIDTCDFTNDSLYLGIFYNIQGVAFGELQQRSTAIRLFKTALQIFKIKKYKLGELQAINNIGLVYYYNNEYDKAKEYFINVIQMHNKADSFNISSTYLNLANIYDAQQDQEQAKKYYFKIINNTNSDNKLKCLVYNGLANMYLKLGDILTAYKYVNKSKELKNITPKINDVICVKTKADILLKADSLEQAKVLYLHALTYSKKLNLYTRQVGILKKLALIYKKLNKPEKSYNKLFEALDLMDSLRFADILKSSKLQEEFFLHEQEKYNLMKEKNRIELQEHQAQLKITKQRIWLIVMISVFFILLVSILLLKKNHRDKIKYIKENNKLKLEYQMEVASQLEAEVNLKIEQFTEIALILSQQNEFLKDIKTHIDKIKSRDYPELTDIKIRLSSIIKSYKDKEIFYSAIENINSGIINNLKNKYSNITDNDIRLICLSKLDMSNKEIANLIGTSVKNIEMAKYRLKKKLYLGKDESLEDLL